MENINQRIEKLLKDNNVILFMKGDKSFPQCGFSAQVIEILNRTGVNYSTFDILADAEIRSGLKAYSNWPTYPQLYIKGELVGGCDIVTDLFEKNELAGIFQSKGVL